jgi:hypothetical protein
MYVIEADVPTEVPSTWLIIHWSLQSRVNLKALFTRSKFQCSFLFYKINVLNEIFNFVIIFYHSDRLCGLVVRVRDYRSRGPGSIPGTTRKKVVGLERGLLSLVSTTEELLDRKVAAFVYKIENTAVGIRHDYHVAPSIRRMFAITSPTSGGRSFGIVRSRTQTMEFRSFLFYHSKFRNIICR